MVIDYQLHKKQIEKEKARIEAEQLEAEKLEAEALAAEGEKENGDAEEEALLQYPVDILIRTEDGETTVTINNQEEMEALEEECRE